MGSRKQCTVAEEVSNSELATRLGRSLLERGRGTTLTGDRTKSLVVSARWRSVVYRASAPLAIVGWQLV